MNSVRWIPAFRTVAVGSVVGRDEAHGHEIEINAMGPTPEQMQRFLSLPDGTIVMVNLLKFKADGGAEEYRKYGDKVRVILDSIGARILFSGEAKVCMIGAGDWDSVALRVPGDSSPSRGRARRSDQLRRRADPFHLAKAPNVVGFGDLARRDSRLLSRR